MSARKYDRLEAYRAKRSADRTPEPFGATRVAGGQVFVVQHHAARRLHYDLRLELDGVLISWAVPKGPSPNPADKRLAVHVEDHPLEYADFEGRIPEGNYGAGASIVWDRGVWVPIEDPNEGLEKGKLLFELKGYKLRGKWTLVKTKQDWLLIKERDAYATEQGTEDYPPDSILSGLTVEELGVGRDPIRKIRARLKKLGARRERVSGRAVDVMLAKPGKPFSRRGWLFEIKYDGYRLIVDRDGEDTRLWSRAGNDLTQTFPEIATAIGKLPFEHMVIDGEAVVHDERGIPSFSRLQRRGRLSRKPDIRRASIELPATLYAFDLMALDDYDLRPLPLLSRKEILKDVLPSVGPIRYSDHVEEHGEAMFQQVSNMGLEGIVAKKADSRYLGGRSTNWTKISTQRSDDFVVVGYTDPKGSQTGFGALVLGQYEDGRLVHVGRVGTGFGQRELKEIGSRLEELGSGEAVAGAPNDTIVHWVQSELVAEVRYKEFTADGVLRQPAFLRLRDDKPPEECIRRTDQPLPEPVAPREVEPQQRTIHFTNLDKIFWPEQTYTKGDLIEYYRGISEWLLPYLEDRPVVLTRYPDGIDGKSFFQKDAPGFAPDWMRIERMWSESTQREVRYFIVDNVESLLYIANMGTIPLHVWSSRVSTLERPDWCILDLDPKGAPFSNVVEIAKAIQSLCEEIELPSFVKTSGSTGLHVLLPLDTQYTYEQSRHFGELLARVIVSELPEIATVTRRPSDREGKVYIDYVQNGHGRLLVSPFSVRPLPGAPVSMPLRWREVNRSLDISRFTIKNAARRMRSLKADPLRDVLELKPDLPAVLKRLGRRFG